MARIDVARLVELNATYARVIDNEQFERWPDLFHDPCLYKVTTAENVAKGFEAGIIYADTRGMLHDRVSSLLKVNIYERQRYRHIVGLPVVLDEHDGTADVETSFLIVRIMRDGTTLVFVEVRKRSGSRFGGAAESIGRQKQSRLQAAISLYLANLAQLPACRAAGVTHIRLFPSMYCKGPDAFEGFLDDALAALADGSTAFG